MKPNLTLDSSFLIHQVIFALLDKMKPKQFVLRSQKKKKPSRQNVETDGQKSLFTPRAEPTCQAC